MAQADNGIGNRMAIYHLQVKVIGRSAGRSAIAAAAYRAGEALHDAELGRTFNYLSKPGVIHSEIMLPAGAPSRWKDRETLWNEVAARDPQANDDRRVPDDPDAPKRNQRRQKQLAREIELSLPRELSQAEAIALAQDFVDEQFVSRGMVADLNVHCGDSADGEAQPHAHIMLTMRRVAPGPDGQPEAGTFGLKERSWNDKALLLSWRTRWAELANARLAEAGLEARIDHRSNAARGIDLEPQHKIGPAGARRGVRGEDAERADEHRAIARRNGEKLLAQPALALQALTEQQSTFTRADLARLVHRHSDGAAQFAAIMAKVEAAPELIRVGKDGRDRIRYSTREMAEIERRMEAAALELSCRTTHAVDADRRRAVLATSTLGDEQRLAFGHVTRARDLTVVIGYAGTGKSTMLGAARLAWGSEGYTVRGAALSGIAAEGLESGSGIASRTIASWEHAWAQGKELLGPRDVLVLDEAGMVGSRQMARVLDAVRQSGAKLVMVGDHEQLQAIEAGAAFRAIAERVGAIEITEIRRQQVEWQRDATKELATGKTTEALDRYRQAGMVRAHATEAAAREALIAEWQTARTQAPHETQIILAHSRDEVRTLNETARAIRRTNRELGEDQMLPTELGLRNFAIGERIYFLRNERGLGVKNGTLGTIIDIRLDGKGEGAPCEGARLSVRLDHEDQATGAAKLVTFSLSEYADLDHGYAATVHKAQSVTVDRAHVLATPGMDRHLAYVALSRHRQSATLHWSEETFGSSARMAARLSRERAKDTTLDYGESEAELYVAYAERRGLRPMAPVSESIVGTITNTAAAPRARLQRGRLAPAIRIVLSALQQAVELQAATIAGIAAALISRKQEPKQKQDRADLFAGLSLNAGPLSAPVPVLVLVPEPAPLAAAASELLLAIQDSKRMEMVGLPVLPHQKTAIDAARQKIDKLRPGFADDLIEASKRDRTAVGRASHSATGIAAFINAGERVQADREETARRQVEYEALAPVRDRLLKERMETWWRQTYPYNRSWERSNYMLKEAKPIEAALKQEITAIPVVELRQIEAAWVRADRVKKPGAAPSPAPSRSGPSPF